MMQMNDFESPYEMMSPPQFDAVPFARSRNRKTMQDYDFLLNAVSPSRGNDDGMNLLSDMSTTRNELHATKNDHASFVFESVRKSQAMHELSAPRLLAPAPSTSIKRRRNLGRRRSFDGALSETPSGGDGGGGRRGGGGDGRRNTQSTNRLPSVSGRDDARLLNNAFDSLLTRWSNHVPGQNPKKLLKKFVDQGNVQATLNILDPELRILKATMVTLSQQVGGKCIEQANLMDRVESRYRRAIRILIQLAQKVQVLRAQVAQRIPQVEQGRMILVDAAQALREQVESTVAAGDGRVDRSKFQDALERLATNTFNQPKNPEVRELRKLERCVSDLQQGRIAAEMAMAGVEKELNAVRSGYEDAMARVADDMKVLQKTLSSLRKNEGLTKKQRDDRINQSMDEAFQRAQAIAAGSVSRLEKENGNLQAALSQIKRQLTQQHFESNTSFAEVGLQCDISGEEDAVTRAKELKTQKKKAKADAKKKAKQDKKKARQESKKKKKASVGATATATAESEDEGAGEGGSQEEKVEEMSDHEENVDDSKMMEMKMQMQKLSHMVLEKEAQIQYLQNVIKKSGESTSGGSGSGQQNRGTHKKETATENQHASIKDSRTMSTQYEANPIPMDNAQSSSDVHQGRKGSKEGGRKDTNRSGKGKRPRRRQRGGGGGGGGGGVGVQQAAPDAEADIRWARCWMSISCAAAAVKPDDGGLKPGISFTKIMRRELLRVCGSQGFGDLVMFLVVNIVRKHAEKCRLLNLFSILLGITPVKPMESSDDTGIKSASNEAEEFHAIVISVLALSRADQVQIDSGAFGDGHLGQPILVPPNSPHYRCSLHQTKETVGIVCGQLGIPKPMAKSYQKAAMAFGEGFPKQAAVDVCDIIDVVDGAWRDQYARRKVQLGAQYSMASATTNWFSRLETTQALRKMERTFSHEDANEVYRSAVAMIRNYSAVTSTSSSTKTNPGVSIRTLIPALIRASWMHLKGNPRWVPSPQRLHGGEDLLSLVNESMSAMPRHMASLMQKYACKQLRKLLIRMKHELKDALSSIDEHAHGSPEYSHAVAEHGERLMVLMQEIGSFACGQDETTVRAQLKELTGR